MPNHASRSCCSACSRLLDSYSSPPVSVASWLTPSLGGHMKLESVWHWVRTPAMHSSLCCAAAYACFRSEGHLGYWQLLTSPARWEARLGMIPNVPLRLSP